MRFDAKKILLSVIGMLIMAFGCGMLIKAGWGADTSNALMTGIAAHTPLTVGQVNAVGSAVMIVLVYLLQKKYIGIAMFVTVLLIQFPIDLAISICPSFTNVFAGALADVVSCYVISFGACMMIAAGLGCSPYDGLALTISDRFHIRFMIAKYLLDGFCVVMGLLLGGEVGLGTIIVFLCMGYFISFNRQLMKKLFPFGAES